MKGYFKKSEEHALNSRGVKTKQLQSRGLGGGDVYADDPVTIDMKDFTAYLKSGRGQGTHIGRSFFLTKKFEDDCLLGFWSDAPWGRTRDTDRGWVIIKPLGHGRGKVVDVHQSYDFGYTKYDSYDRDKKTFMEQARKEHGKTKVLRNKFDDVWKMGDG